jgi:GDPmannose 4,6-dehydratase
MMGSGKKALVFGAGGMDGSHMVDLLLEKNYSVVGIGLSESPENISHIRNSSFQYLRCDISNLDCIKKIIHRNPVDEIYNFAGISFDPAASNNSELTFKINRDSAIQMAECSTEVGSKFFQASSSEVFGILCNSELNEETPRNPHSPYSRAKNDVDSYISRKREDGHKLYTGIFFTHESERRNQIFLVRKITSSVAKIKSGEIDSINLGNIKSRRDWGNARNFIDASWRIMQNDPDDYIIATGKTHSVSDVLRISFEHIGMQDWESYIVTSDDLVRPGERNNLWGDTTKIRSKTGWIPDGDFHSLITGIIDFDLANDGTK